jgi:hypothetical protein
LYRLDGAGKISTAEWIEAESDDDARRRAMALVDQSSFELWDKSRLVERVHPSGKSSGLTSPSET